MLVVSDSGPLFLGDHSQGSPLALLLGLPCTCDRNKRHPGVSQWRAFQEGLIQRVPQRGLNLGGFSKAPQPEVPLRHLSLGALRWKVSV